MTTPVRFWSARFWRHYWTTMRPYLFFVSGASGLLGLAMAGNVPAYRMLVGCAPIFLSYGLGQALTDVFQTDTDALSSPYRPLVRGEIAPRDVLLVSLVGLALCGLTLAMLAPWSIALSALAVAGLATYTPLKRRFWGGPAWNSAVVALLPAIGLLVGGVSARVALRHKQLPFAMGSVFFSYAVFVIIGYLKDVEADRATGYETVAVRFGRRSAVACSALSLVVALACSLRLLSSDWPASSAVRALVAWTLWGWGGLAMLLAHVRGFGVSRDDEAHPAVALSVRGFVALHLGEVAWLRPALALPCVGLLTLFELGLRQRPSRFQI